MKCQWCEVETKSIAHCEEAQRNGYLEGLADGELRGTRAERSRSRLALEQLRARIDEMLEETNV